ncbi:MAG: universal stress protein [Chitinophagales bacterium]
MDILFPTDLSERSAEHFAFALDLAQKLGDSITLLHVYPVPVNYPTLEEGRMGDVSEELLNATSSAMEERMRLFKEGLSNRYASTHPGMTRVNTALRMGFPGDEVARAAAEMQARFVIIGVKQSSGLKRFFGGSKVSAILKKCEVPIVTIPDGYTYKPIDRIGYATDLTFSDNSVINNLLGLATSIKAQVRCFHVHDSNLDVENSIIDDFIKQYKTEANNRLITFELVDNINTLDGIDYFIQNHDIDMLAVLKQKSYWLEIFDASMTKKLVFHEQIPLIIFHE